MDTITEFQGEHRFLSNFYMEDLMLENHLYFERVFFKFPSAENAFQACKVFYTDLDEAAKLKALFDFTKGTPGQAKRLGRKVSLSEKGVQNWNRDARGWMLYITRIKYENAELADLLLATGDATLVEGNNWGDKRWGQVNGEGENLLGKILMRVRQELTEARESGKIEA